MYLTADELKNTYYKQAATVPADQIDTYLMRANAYAFGIVGGVPTGLNTEESRALKSAVALAFETFAKGETGQADPTTGDITEAVPGGVYIRKTDPLKAVEKMLQPFADRVATQGITPSSKEVRFL